MPDVAVTDVTTTSRQTLYLHNTDVAASVTFATRYCAHRGLAHNLGFALGTTASQKTYAAGDYAGWMTTLYNYVDTNNIGAIIVGAGCPSRIGLLTADGTENGANDGNGFDFVHVVGAIKHIVGTMGYAPRVLVGGGDTALVKKYGGGWTLAQEIFSAYQSFGAGGTNFPTVLETYADADYAAAVAADVGQDHGDYNVWTRHRSDFDGDYSGLSFLPVGWAGAYSGDAAAHAGTLHDDSVAVINRAVASEGYRASLTARKVLCALGSYLGTRNEWGQCARWATVAKRFDDLGFDVEYFWTDDSDQAGNYLMPWAGAKAGWTAAALNAGTATGSVTYDVAFGPAFANNSQQGGSGSVWHGAADNIRTSANGLFVGGASNQSLWAIANQIAGHSAITMPVSGNKHSFMGHWCALLADAMQEVIRGRTLLEAAFVGHRGTIYPVGDPLCRPFRV